MRIFCKLILSILLIITTLFAYNIILAAKLDPAKGSLFMKADRVEYDERSEIIVADGNIVIQFENYLLRADYVYYDIKHDHLFAEGNIRVEDDNNRIVIGQKAVFSDKLKKGIIDEFILKIGDSHLMASAAERIDENKSYLYKSTYTSCDIYCSKEPIWKVSAQETFVDFEKHQIVYANMFFQIYGVPVMYMPYFSHPTPQAPAQTGLLIPEMKQESLLVPFYFRLRNNMDVTISPRLSENYTIFEFEARHKLKEGSYKLQGSLGDTPHRVENAGGVVKNTKTHQYHIFAEGQFKHNDLNYGFDIRRTSSDKAYLKNYHQILDSYLTSKLYVNKINRKNYFSLDGLYFQDLRSESSREHVPFIFPSFKHKTVIPVSDDETANISVIENLMLYNESYVRQIARNALEITASKNIFTNTGQIINFGVSNRADYYYTNIESNDKVTNNRVSKEKILFRNIPEAFASWRYPFISDISSKSSMKIEPILSTTIGRTYERRFDNFGLIDSSKYDISEETLFNQNRVSGIDFHEYGKRLNYGANLSLYSDILYLSSFLGQALHQDNIQKSNNQEHVGSVLIEIANQISVMHKFRKDKDLSPIRDEFEFSFMRDKFSFSANYTTLHNISRYFADNNFSVKNNKLKNATFNASLEIIDGLTLTASSIYDLSEKRKFNQLTRTIGVTYIKDCVSIYGKLSDDFTQDKGRGVKKIRSKSFSIGLKGLNM